VFIVCVIISGKEMILMTIADLLTGSYWRKFAGLPMFSSPKESQKGIG
jgi:hypothetical protein